MADDRLAATRIIDAPAEAIFAVLTDPSKHAAIDGTGWVRHDIGEERLTAVGQIFRMAMYHPNHPDRADGRYETVNRIRDLEPPKVISWETGYDAGGGDLRFGGWYWRYDLAPTEDRAGTAVTLTYDWSGAPGPVRELIGFPPFPVDHLVDSLAHLAELVAGGARR